MLKMGPTSKWAWAFIIMSLTQALIALGLEM